MRNRIWLNFLRKPFSFKRIAWKCTLKVQVFQNYPWMLNCLLEFLHLPKIKQYSPKQISISGVKVDPSCLAVNLCNSRHLCTMVFFTMIIFPFMIDRICGSWSTYCLMLLWYLQFNTLKVYTTDFLSNCSHHSIYVHSLQ